MKKIAILGGGISGTGSAVLAQTKGYEVFLSDKGKIADKYKEILEKYGIPYEEGKHTEERILDASEIVKSPGIPDKSEIVVKARSAGIPVISEIEFAGRYDGARKICITGSNGKTTTTSLIYHIFRTAGLNAGLGGNIGKGYALQVATEKFDCYVLELSSFQLDGMYTFKADTAILTNITPDHLDRYDYKVENYTASKFRILQNMTSEDNFIFSSDDPITCSYRPKVHTDAHQLPFSTETEPAEGGYFDGKRLRAVFGNRKFTIDAAQLQLKGRHNMYNALAAILASLAEGVSDEAITEGLKTFSPVEHRLEPVAVINGVRYINDSKATNIDSVKYALESMTEPTVWIAGGTDKGNDYSTLFQLVREKVRILICLGVDNRKLHDSFEGKVEKIIDTRSAEEAVNAAAAEARNGECVLLSPACASFDLFKNYEDRGRQFKDAVKRLQ